MVMVQIKRTVLLAGVVEAFKKTAALEESLLEEGIANVIKKRRRFFFFRHSRRSASEFFRYGALFCFTPHEWIDPFYKWSEASRDHAKFSAMRDAIDTEAIEPLVTMDQEEILYLHRYGVLKNVTGLLTG